MFPKVLYYILFSFMSESNKSGKAAITWGDNEEDV